MTSTIAAFGFLMSLNARADEVSGKALYNRKCATCLGADGVTNEMWAKQGAKSAGQESAILQGQVQA